MAAAVLGAWFLLEIRRLAASPSRRAAMRVFRDSIVYLTLLFAAVAVDALRGHGA